MSTQEETTNEYFTRVESLSTKERQASTQKARQEHVRRLLRAGISSPKTFEWLEGANVPWEIMLIGGRPLTAAEKRHARDIASSLDFVGGPT